MAAVKQAVQKHNPSLFSLVGIIDVSVMMFAQGFVYTQQ